MRASSSGRRRSRRRLRRVLFIATAATLTAFVVAAYAGDVLRDSELDTVDTRFSIRGTEDTPRDVAVVAIDENSINRLGPWPFRRSLHARMIDRLRRAGARVIVYDVQFTEQTSPVEDNALIDAVDRADRVVLATTAVEEDGSTLVFGGDDVVRSVGARVGSGQLPNDPGGVLRRMEYEPDGLKTIGVVAAEEFARRKVDASELPGGDAWIDYAGPPGTVATYPFERVLRGRVPAQAFRGRAVVVGPEAPSLQDIHPTSTASEGLMSGAEIQANAVHTALEGFPLDEAPAWLDVALIVLFGLVGPVAAMRFGPVRAVIAGLVVGLLFALAAQLAFGSGLIVSFLYPLAALVLGVVGAFGVALAVGAFERERVRDLFARFVPEAVVDQVLSNADEDLRLGGETRTVTVLFSDIRGFTTFSETHSPGEVLDVLNRYLRVMTDVILDHGGTLCTYLGDGIMAVFGAPLDQVDHADRALAAAREMAGPSLQAFNDEMRAEGVLDEPLKIGIGLNSGPVMAGNVGSERRLEYTMIGDTVNTGSRLEGMTKGTPHTIFVADSTRAMLTRSHAGLEHVDDLEVRGRQARISVWSMDAIGADPPVDDPA